MEAGMPWVPSSSWQVFSVCPLWIYIDLSVWICRQDSQVLSMDQEWRDLGLSLDRAVGKLCDLG